VSNPHPTDSDIDDAMSGACRLKRLVAGVSGYIFDECVTNALRF